MSWFKSLRFVLKLAACVSLTACASHSAATPNSINSDELFHRAAKHHQELVNNVWQATGTHISYEDAAFQINLNHRKEVMRVLRCAKAQDGFAQNAVYQGSQRYELHFYFKGDAKQKLAKCTRDPLFIAHRTRYDLDELKTVAEKASAILAHEAIVASFVTYGPSHLLFEAQPDAPTVLSEEGYIQISVEKENLGPAKKALASLMKRHEFLFLVEGSPYVDEVIMTVDELLN